MIYLKKYILFIFLMCSSLVHSAHEIREGNIIRDAEIEAVLKSYIDPLFKAAHLDPDTLKLYIIATSEINAAATFNYTLLINTGFIMCCERPEEVIGVLAHETGHIAGGHIVRRIGVMEKTSKAMIASMLLGAAAAIAGAPDVGIGLMMAGQDASMSSLMHYTRGQESAADQAGVRLLDSLGWSAGGCLQFMERIKSFELRGSYPDYMRTHPPTDNRIDFLKTHCKNSQYTNLKLPETFYVHFERIRAKIKAFMDPPYTTLLKYQESDQSIPARYARAIAHYRNGESAKALPLMNKLISDFPNDAYFHELQGQILFENGQLMDSIASYRKAVQLSPNELLIRVSYAQALIETDREAAMYEAIQELTKAKQAEKDMPFLWRLFAIAYGKTNQMALSALSLAEEALIKGQFEHAISQAKRAKHFGLKGPQLVRAGDIIAFAEHEMKNQDKSVL